MDWRALKRSPWAIGGVAAVLATAILGFAVLRPAGALDVVLEPADALGIDPFMVLDGEPELRLGNADLLSIDGGFTVKVGIEPGLYGGSGSDHLCDPQLIAQFLSQDSDKAEAWAEVVGIDVDEIDLYLSTLTPARLLADTWVTNHGYSNGRATPRQSILQAGTMVLVDDTGVPRVRCKCGNPLLPPKLPSGGQKVNFVGDPWPGFDPDRILVIEPGAPAVDYFELVRLEDGARVGRFVGTLGAEDVLIDANGRLVPDLGVDLPASAAVGDGPFALPDTNSAGLPITYSVTGPCSLESDGIVLTGQGRCLVSVTTPQSEPWAGFDARFEIEVEQLPQSITVPPIDHLVIGEEPVAIDALADSLLEVVYSTAGPCRMDAGGLVGTDVGVCELTISQPGSSRWAKAQPVTISIDVRTGEARTPVEITFDDFPSKLRLGDEPVPMGASASPTRPITYALAGSCESEGRGNNVKLVPTGIGLCQVVASAVDDDQFRRATATIEVIINPRSQSFGLEGLPDSVVADDAAIPLPASTSAGIDITYTTSGPCQVVGGSLTFTGKGTCELTASAAGNADTESATEAHEIIIADAIPDRASQTISFSRPGPLVVGGSGVTLRASASSGLAVTLTVTSGDCTLNGRTLRPVSAGTCTITASQRGNDAFFAAPNLSRTVTVAKATPTLTISVTGGSASQMTAGDSRTVTGTVSAGPAAAITAVSGPCTSSGNTVTAADAESGSCVVTVGSGGGANHAAVSDSVTIAVVQNQTVKVSVGDSSLFPSQTTSVSASTTSGLGLSISASPSSVCTLSGSTISAVAAGTCTITASQAGNDAYLAASDTTSLAVDPISQPTITFTGSSSATVDTAFKLTASSSEPSATVNLAVTSGPCKNDGGGSFTGTAIGTCVFTASHGSGVGYSSASNTFNVNVSGKADGIKMACDNCSPTFGNSGDFQITTLSGLGVSLSASGGCSISVSSAASGDVNSFVTKSLDQCNITASTKGNGQWAPASQTFTFDIIPNAGFIDLSPSSTTVTPGTQVQVGVLHTFGSGATLTASSTNGCTTLVNSLVSITVVAVDTDVITTCTVTVSLAAPGYIPSSNSFDLNVFPSILREPLPDPNLGDPIKELTPIEEIPVTSTTVT